jgi:hypothetical protein
MGNACYHSGQKHNTQSHNFAWYVVVKLFHIKEITQQPGEDYVMRSFTI